ncbi:hypothetical protein RvY_19013 [Ramazzottius varieornatus]|uniref:Uncharacterized protein n=1 Tax=Ramazzottius varieornatus TaxID=947166 RepID=A0A1D1WBE8_RAMVA|nr:hypothetical protein RvY_19013 [Ramazzottius varieornatus]
MDAPEVGGVMGDNKKVIPNIGEEDGLGAALTSSTRRARQLKPPSLLQVRRATPVYEWNPCDGHQGANDTGKGSNQKHGPARASNREQRMQSNTDKDE